MDSWDSNCRHPHGPTITRTHSQGLGKRPVALMVGEHAKCQELRGLRGGHKTTGPNFQILKISLRVNAFGYTIQQFHY